MPVGSEITILLKPVAAPSSVKLVSVPHPAGIVEPVNEKPSTTLPPVETVKPASAASPPDAPLAVVPSTLN